MFTGDEFADGGEMIADELEKHNIKASFFFTGRFYRNPAFKKIIRRLKKDGHYLGAHSDRHLLYCDWTKRDSLLVTKQEFKKDLLQNYAEMAKYGIPKHKALFFLPPYEWYNDSISKWTNELGLQLVNFTPGTRSTADYTYPALKNYQDSETIFKSITGYVASAPAGLNGFLLLLHIGTDPQRTDKFYHHLGRLINYLNTEGYHLQSVDKLLQPG